MTGFELLLSNSDDTYVASGVAHAPGTHHAEGARRTSVGHAYATTVTWCRTCYPNGGPR